METAVLIAIAFLLFFYGLLLVRYAIAWKKMPVEEDMLPGEPVLKVSIVIPARNEEKNIGKCLQALRKQNFPRDSFSVLIVNDHSQDATVSVVEDFIRANPDMHVKLLSLSNEGGSKKAAIEAGLKSIDAGLVITTDADCSMGPLWLRSMHCYFEKKDLKMLSGPVMFSGNSLFSRLQNLEFCGLVAIGGASLNLGSPNMCNGANLAYLREAFDEVGGYRGNEHIASGDDEFLFHKMTRRYPGKVAFLKSREAIVSTPALKGIRNFIWQRMRWVSKSTKYENKWITITLILAYLLNLAIPLSLLLPAGLWICLTILFLKLFFEGLFFTAILPFFGQKRLLFLLPLAEIPHVLYVLFIGIAGNLVPYQWKGRRH